MVLIKKIHKWASVIVGIQFLLWLLSGLYFNLMDHHKAGGQLYKNNINQQINIKSEKLIDLKGVLEQFKPSISIELTYLLAKPYYLLTHKKGLYRSFENSYTLVNAYTGEQVIIDYTYAEKLAKYSYNGPGKTSAIALLQPPFDDFPKHKNAAWQVNFSDDINTSVYVEATSGFILGHSDDHKRLAGIFFMLHFMDYGNEGRFNSVQIIIFAFITLWLSLTGLIVTIDLGLRGQYKIKFIAKQQDVTLFDKNQQMLGKISLSSNHSVLTGLTEHDITLPSICGGGGTCGCCKVMLNPTVEITSADRLHFTSDEIQQGYRLACQHFSHEVKQVTLISFDTKNILK
jgi:ferredoxin